MIRILKSLRSTVEGERVGPTSRVSKRGSEIPVTRTGSSSNFKSPGSDTDASDDTSQYPSTTTTTRTSPIRKIPSALWVNSKKKTKQRISSSRFFGHHSHTNHNSKTGNKAGGDDTEGLLNNYSRRIRTFYVTTSTTTTGSRKAETENDLSSCSSSSDDDDGDCCWADVGSFTGGRGAASPTMTACHNSSTSNTAHPIRNRLFQQVRSGSRKFGAVAGRVMERSWIKLQQDEEDYGKEEDGMFDEINFPTTITTTINEMPNKVHQQVCSPKVSKTTLPNLEEEGVVTNSDTTPAAPPSVKSLNRNEQEKADESSSKQDKVEVDPPIKKLVIRRSSPNADDQFYEDILSTRPRYSSNLEEKLARRVREMLSSLPPDGNDSIPSDLKSSDDGESILDEDILSKYYQENHNGEEYQEDEDNNHNMEETIVFSPIVGADDIPEKKCLVLMMDPERKIFEIVQLSYQPESSTVGEILQRLSDEATDPRLGQQRYTGLAHEGRNIVVPSVPLDILLEAKQHARATAESHNINSDDTGGSPQLEGLSTPILLPVPELYTALEVELMARRIMKSPKVGRMLDLFLCSIPDTVEGVTTSLPHDDSGVVSNNDENQHEQFSHDPAELFSSLVDDGETKTTNGMVKTTSMDHPHQGYHEEQVHSTILDSTSDITDPHFSSTASF